MTVLRLWRRRRRRRRCCRCHCHWMTFGPRSELGGLNPRLARAGGSSGSRSAQPHNGAADARARPLVLLDSTHKGRRCNGSDRPAWPNAEPERQLRESHHIRGQARSGLLCAGAGAQIAARNTAAAANSDGRLKSSISSKSDAPATTNKCQPKRKPFIMAEVEVGAAGACLAGRLLGSEFALWAESGRVKSNSRAVQADAYFWPPVSRPRSMEPPAGRPLDRPSRAAVCGHQFNQQSDRSARRSRLKPSPLAPQLAWSQQDGAAAAAAAARSLSGRAPVISQ